MSTNGNGKQATRSAALDEDLQAVQKRQRAIGRRLRSLFDDVVAEGVPDDFEDLLDRLRESEEAGRNSMGQGAGQVKLKPRAGGEDAR